MRTTIYFDMDGTIADLYGVENWLDFLIAKEELPYEIAKPLVRLSLLARYLNKLQRKGYRIGIISWLAKNSNEDFDERVTKAKREWLSVHLSSVQFDEINIVPYGTPKSNFSNDSSDILFDDEIQNRENWNGVAYDVDSIIEILKAL
jgi:5'(3')-deoxyribonucleotidase